MALLQPLARPPAADSTPAKGNPLAGGSRTYLKADFAPSTGQGSSFLRLLQPTWQLKAGSGLWAKPPSAPEPVAIVF